MNAGEKFEGCLACFSTESAAGETAFGLFVRWMV